jgi:hypothetical protein
VKVDASEVVALRVALATAAATMDARALPVVRKGLLNMKKDWQTQWTGIRMMPHLPASVTFDSTLSATGPEGEVGPDKERRQGALGNIAEYGTSRHGPIRPVAARIAAAEAARFEDALGRVAERL